MCPRSEEVEVEMGEREEEEKCETGKKEDGKTEDGEWYGLIKKLPLVQGLRRGCAGAARAVGQGIRIRYVR